jgi:hypothetical protein
VVPVGVVPVGPAEGLEAEGLEVALGCVLGVAEGDVVAETGAGADGEIEAEDGVLGVPLSYDEEEALNPTVAQTATSAKDVVVTAIRLRTVRFLPRIRAAEAPGVCAAPAARSMASESVVSKSLDTVRSPFG